MKGPDHADRQPLRYRLLWTAVYWLGSVIVLGALAGILRSWLL